MKLSVQHCLPELNASVAQLGTASSKLAVAADRLRLTHAMADSMKQRFSLVSTNRLKSMQESQSSLAAMRVHKLDVKAGILVREKAFHKSQLETQLRRLSSAAASQVEQRTAETQAAVHKQLEALSAQRAAIVAANKQMDTHIALSQEALAGLQHKLASFPATDDETAVRYEDLEREHAIFQLESDVSKATADLRSTEAELAAVLEGTAHTAAAAAAATTPARRKRGRAEIGAAGSSQTKLALERELRLLKEQYALLGQATPAKASVDTAEVQADARKDVAAASGLLDQAQAQLAAARQRTEARGEQLIRLAQQLSGKVPGAGASAPARTITQAQALIMKALVTSATNDTPLTLDSIVKEVANVGAVQAAVNHLVSMGLMHTTTKGEFELGSLQK